MLTCSTHLTFKASGRVVGQRHKPLFSPTHVRESIDEAIRAIIKRVFSRAFSILEGNRPVLERCSRELLAKETLDEAAIRELTRDIQLPPPGQGGP
jgi:ATP-dependent Zn protease